MIQRLHPCLAFCCILVVPAMSAQTLQIINAEGRSTTITAAQIAGAPHVTVEVHDHDAPAHFAGVPLAAVLAMAGVELGDKLRGNRLAEVLLVQAADGYKVVFAVAEIDPAFATREIILADKRDAKPLDGKEGPLRVVAPGDTRPARWVRQVTTLKIVAVQ